MPWLLLVFLLAWPVRPPARPAADFLKQQRTFARVREAYEAKGATVDEALARLGLKRDQLHLLLVAYKEDEELEVWAKKPAAATYRLLTTYPICNSSGTLGPKRVQGDEQTPEGFYYIDRFNPASTYHLSLGINYPNPADRYASDGRPLGGDIFIHGKCVTVGCLPLTDARIQELYILAVEARANGQQRIPVYLFPTRLTAENRRRLEARYAAADPSLAAFWRNLQVGYEAFAAHHREVRYGFDRTRGYVFQ